MTQQLEQFVDRGMKAQAAVDAVLKDLAPATRMLTGSRRLLDIDGRLKRIREEAASLRAERDKLERDIIDAGKLAAAEQEAPLLPFDAAANGNGQAADRASDAEETAPPAPPSALRVEIEPAGEEPRAVTIVSDTALAPPPAEILDLAAIEPGRTYTREELGVHIEWLEQCVGASRIFPAAPDFKGDGGTIDSVTRVAGKAYTVTGCSVRREVVRYRLTPVEAAKDRPPVFSWKFVLDRRKGAPEEAELNGMGVIDGHGQEWCFHSITESVFCEVQRAELGTRLRLGYGARTWDETPAPDLNYQAFVDSQTRKPAPTPEHKKAVAARHAAIKEGKRLHAGVGGYVAENPSRLPIPYPPEGQSLTWHQWRSQLLKALKTVGVDDVEDIYPTGQALEWFNAGLKPKAAAEKHAKGTTDREPVGRRGQRDGFAGLTFGQWFSTFAQIYDVDRLGTRLAEARRDDPAVHALFFEYPTLRPAAAARRFMVTAAAEKPAKKGGRR